MKWPRIRLIYFDWKLAAALAYMGYAIYLYIDKYYITWLSRFF